MASEVLNIYSTVEKQKRVLEKVADNVLRISGPAEFCSIYENHKDKTITGITFENGPYIGIGKVLQKKYKVTHIVMDKSSQAADIHAYLLTVKTIN